MGKILQSTCLKPQYSLRRQLLVTFGSIGVLTIAIALLLATITAKLAGQIVPEEARDSLRTQVFHSIQLSSEQIADVISRRFSNLEGLAALQSFIVEDRIIGYPDKGWENDTHVPFFDLLTQTRRYPLNSPLLPQEWNVSGNFDIKDAAEHVQERADLLLHFQQMVGVIDTSTASYRFQGNCDPSKISPRDRAYYRNCTAANNDVSTGGVVLPVETNKYLAQKAADISPLMKPLWEVHPEVLLLTINFHNSGAGSVLSFPAFPADGTASYISEGCEWMKQTNPLTGRPFATLKEVARCRPRGTIVNERDYNPVEREWCADQATHPGQVRSFGPYRGSDNALWLLSYGKAVFDRMTGEFIGCSVAQIELSRLKAVFDIGSMQNYTEFVLVRPDGTIVVSDLSRWNHFNSPESVNIKETDFVSEEIFEQFVELWDFENTWTHEEVQERLKQNWVSTDNEVFASVPIPLPPKDYDENYEPHYYLLLSIGDEIFSPIDDVEERVEEDVREVIVKTVAIGVVGLLVVLLVVWTVSRVLTLPLNWMESVAWRIVNHNDVVDGALHLTSIAMRESSPTLVRFTPKTEITELVSEFRTMIRGFSGRGASSVARKETHEVLNEVTWQNEFQQLYSRLSSRTIYKDRDDDEDEACTESSTVSSTQSPAMPLAALSSNQKLEESPAMQAATVSLAEGPNLSSEPSSPLGMIPVEPLGSIGKKKKVAEESSMPVVSAPPRSNMGLNSVSVLDRQDEERRKMHLRTELDRQKTRVWRSSLFWWIVFLIVLPLLLTNIAICALVSYNIFYVLPRWITSLRDASYDIEMELLTSSVKLRASFTEAVMVEPIRDHHLMTRVAGWLLFGSLSHSGSFTEVLALTEQCKAAEFGECAFYEDAQMAPCDCEWKDPRPLSCRRYDTDSRYLQRIFMCGQAQDADPETGDRYSVSFPLTDASPSDTLWWENIEELPGFSRTNPPSGYDTTFDRVGVISAAAVVSIPIYNYVQYLDRDKHFLGSYFGFENDGMFSGYSGCSYEFSEMSKFQVTEENKAYVFGGTDICPVGKYGYDPRCRGWYEDGHQHGENDGAVFITAPYKFATEREVGISATSAIFDPRTGQHVGQTLLDFAPHGIFTYLKNDNDNDTISIVISPNSDASGADTVVGPGQVAGADPAAIGDVVLPHDEPNSTNRMYFDQNIVVEMKARKVGTQNFTRTEADGTSREYELAFTPVSIRALKATHHDDFARGAEQRMEFVYSLGIAYPIAKLREPFEEIQGDVKEEHQALLMLYLCLVLVILLSVSVFTCMTSVSITKPMIILLRVVQNINAGRIEDAIPPMKGGSAEVNQVYNSFAKLFKIVRVSNSAFFSGNLKWAYYFVCNALQLFRKVNDQKAIGIACNNLGNTMLAMYRENTLTNKCCTVEDVCMANRGKELLDEAIEIGTREFDSEDQDIKKADFAQQLANRHFNRGMFLLLCQGDPCISNNAKDLAYADLLRARQLDGDVRDFWLQKKLMLKNSAEYFDRMIRRLRGLVELYGDEGVRNVWDVRELVEDLDRLLLAAWDQNTAPLFRDFGRVGRLQQLEDAVIRLELSMENVTEAASLGIRMLIEDEYVLESAFMSAATALLSYMKSGQSSPWSAQTLALTKADLRKILKSCKGQTLDAGKCLILSFELSDSWKESVVLNKINNNCLLLYDEYLNDDDYVGLMSFSENVEGDHSVELEKKGDQKRTSFEAAAKPTCGKRTNPTIPTAVQAAVDSAESLDNDTFIVTVIDGSSWSSFSSASIKRQIDRLNRERNTVVNIIIIGLDIVAKDIIEQCRELCMVSSGSTFLEASSETIDHAFDQVASIITGRRATSGSILGGITMEKF